VESYYNKQIFEGFYAEFQLKHTVFKMDYFGSKSPKIAKRWGLPPSDPLASVGWGLRPQTPVQVK